jgi:hypothetical protein
MDYEQSQDFEEENEQDDLLLDEEHPPDAFASHHAEDMDESQHSPAKKASILSQLNKRLPSRPSATEKSPTETMDLKGMATALTQSQEVFMEEIIRLHRNHIRDCTDSGKLESKLLVNLTMKMGKNTSDPAAMSLSFENYCRELDEMLKEKMDGIMQIRSKIRSCFEQQ